MAILCLNNPGLRLDGHAFIGELALYGSVRPVTGVLVRNATDALLHGAVSSPWTQPVPAIGYLRLWQAFSRP